MKKIKTRALVCVALLLLMPSLIQPGKAITSGDNLWYEYWGNYQDYGPDHPQNISTTVTVYDETYEHWAKVALVVSVYRYGYYGLDLDVVYFRVALYWDSFAAEGFQPIPANYVNLYFDKDTDGSNLNDQAIDIEKTHTTSGFHQGWLLDQNIYTDSTSNDREYWALEALSFAVGLFNEPIGIAMNLISLAAAWIPGGGVDYQDADWEDPYATSHWRRPQEYDISSLNPVRQYCFNTYRWFLKTDVNPSTYFGLKVWARVSPADPRFGYYVDLPPVYLRIHRSHTLSISTNGYGTTNPAPGTHTYACGTSVTVTAYPYAGYGFDHWVLDGQIVYGNPITVTMDSDHTLKAYFWGGGGGCPYVSTWDGTRWWLDNNLIPAAEHSNGTDVIDYYKLQQPLTFDEGGYSLLISDVDKHSYIDKVQLLAVDHDPAFNIAVTPHGEILTYRNSTAPQTAITKDDYDVVNLIEKIDDDLYYEGWPDDYLTVDFGHLDITEGAKLLIRTDPWGPPCPVPCKLSIHVQVLKSDGWTDVASFIPRIYWSTDAVDLSAHLPDANGELKVRLYFTGNHKIDYIGLDTTKQEEFETRYANLASATHSTQGDVKETLIDSDDQYAELFPSEQVILKFTVPQNTKDTRDFIIIIEGHYFTIS